MKEEILDRRVRKTRRQLKECLTRLLKEKKIQDITVRELAEMADINRGTFYLHYKDVFDLMDQIKNELIEEVESVLTHHPVPELVARPSLALSELFPLVQENAEIVSILIGENGDLNFVNRLKRIVSDKCLKGWLDLKCSSDPDTLAAFSAFIVSGCVGTVQYWIESGMKESTEQMAILTEDFILKGIRVLENPLDFHEIPCFNKTAIFKNSERRTTWTVVTATGEVVAMAKSNYEFQPCVPDCWSAAGSF